MATAFSKATGIQVKLDDNSTATGVTLVAAVVYNSAKVKIPPTSFQQLTGPQWKGRVGMNDPSQSGPTYPFIAGMMNSLGGVRAGQAYFTRLKNDGLVIHPTNGPTLQALTSGQINVALVQSSAGVGAALGDKKLVVEYLNPATLGPGPGRLPPVPGAGRGRRRRYRGRRGARGYGPGAIQRTVTGPERPGTRLGA
jgi:iron(III) transport system substrate-binding protein